MKTVAYWILFFIIALLIIPAQSYAKRDHHEKWYQEKWCGEKGGKSEVVLPDKTRCDCLTGSHAIEFDFGNKWAEAIGQSLYYSFQTGKRAGIVLIIEHKKSYKYWIRLNSIIKHFNLPIDTWLIGEGVKK
jgi:hypothetical protein